MKQRHFKLLCFLVLVLFLAYVTLRTLSAHNVTKTGQSAGRNKQPMTEEGARDWSPSTRPAGKELQETSTNVKDTGHQNDSPRDLLRYLATKRAKQMKQMPAHFSPSDDMDNWRDHSDTTTAAGSTNAVEPRSAATGYSVEAVVHPRITKPARAEDHVVTTSHVLVTRSGSEYTDVIEYHKASPSAHEAAQDVASSLNIKSLQAKPVSTSAATKIAGAAQWTDVRTTSRLSELVPGGDDPPATPRAMTSATRSHRPFYLFHKSLHCEEPREPFLAAPNHTLSAPNHTLPVPDHTLSVTKHTLPAVGPEVGRPQASGYMVYLCEEEGQRCGGWADRQRGMLSIFLLAHVTGRTFKVDMRTPCNVSNFLQPAGRDWWSREDGMTDGSVTVVDDMRRPVLPGLLQRGVDFNVKFPQDTVYVRTTRDLAPHLARSARYKAVLPSWARHASQATRFRLGWPLLASPSPSVSRRLNALFQRMKRTNRTHTQSHVGADGDTPLKFPVAENATGNATGVSSGDRNKGYSLVCAHLRMGRNPSMPDDANVRNDADAVRMVFTFLQQLVERDHSYVFIATDDEGVRAAARRRFGVELLDQGGSILHIDRQGTLLHACAAFETAILDQLALSQCDVLVMSHSGFSRHAAYLRHQHSGLFLLHHGIIVPCSLH